MQQGHVDLKAYFKAVKNDGYKLKKYHDKETGKLRGYGVEKDGTFMHASDIDRKLTINKLSLGDNKKVLEKEPAVKSATKITEQEKRGGRRK